MKNSCCRYLLPALLLLLITGISMAGCNPLSPEGKTIKLFVQIDIDAFIRSMANDPGDSALNKALALADNAAGDADTDHIALFAAAYLSAHSGSHLAGLFVRPDQHDITLNSTDDAVTAVLKTQAHAVVQQTCSVLQKRLSKVGDGSIEVVGNEKTGDISVAVKTTYSVERVRQYLQSAGEIGFYETYSNEEIIPLLSEINKSMIIKRKAEVKASGSKEPKADTESLSQYVKADEYKDSIASTHYLANVLSLSIGRTGDILSGAVTGYAREQDTASLNAILKSDIAVSKLPHDAYFVYGTEPSSATRKKEMLTLYTLKQPVLSSDVIDGKDISNVLFGFSPASGRPCINLEMTKNGTTRWTKMTEKNAGRCIAIMYDGHMLICPMVDGKITSGETEISGDFTPEQTVDIASILMGGRLPFPVTVTEDNSNK